MPVDHKRIIGPENTFAYQLCPKKDTKNLNLLKDGKRTDNRNSLEHRKIYLKTGVVSQAKGSAYIEVEKTKVIVSVFDPREIPNKVEYSLNGELHCEFKYAPFSCKLRRQHQQDVEEKKFSVVMQRALESAVCRHQFPNFQVDVYALVLENDGSALSAAITCAGLALAQAGVPMYDLVTAVTLGIYDKNYFLDPNANEEDLCGTAPPPFFINNKPIKMECDNDQNGSNSDDNQSDHGLVIVAMLSTHEQISQLHQSGSLSLENFTKCIQALIDANKEVIPLVEKCLVKYVMKTVSNNSNNEEENKH